MLQRRWLAGSRPLPACRSDLRLRQVAFEEIIEEGADGGYGSQLADIVPTGRDHAQAISSTAPPRSVARAAARTAAAAALSGPLPHHAAKTQMAGGAVNRLGHARRRPVAAAIVRGAKEGP